MAELIITDAPGGIDAYQCPVCGKMTPVKRVNDQGELTEEDAEAPRQCVRCKSPMDIVAAKKFEDEQAEKAAATDETKPGRRTVKV